MIVILSLLISFIYSPHSGTLSGSHKHNKYHVPISSINNMSLRGKRSNLIEDDIDKEIAAAFGLAMTM
jgi:hypothetical protein